jgi:phage gp29-like protein
MKNGIWASPTEFVSFAQQAGSLGDQIATRAAAGDLSTFFGLMPNPDPVLKKMGKDITVYKDLLADPLVKGARRRRAAAVTAMERGLDEELSTETPARVRKAVEAMLGKLDIQRIVRDQMDGAFYGYRVSEVMWGQVDGAAAPIDLIAKPCEWFAFEPENGELRFKPLGSLKGAPVPERKFVVVGKMRSWENPYGEPDLAACFWPVVFKRGGLKFWVTFTEKYGMPWPVGKLPRSAQPKEVDDLADKLSAMVRDAVAVVPEDSSVELLTVASAANAELYERLLMFCRSEISIALLGNNQSVELQSNKASAEAAQHVEQDLRDDDAQMVAAGINDLVRYYCEVNYPGAKPPVYAFWETEEGGTEQADRDSKLHQAGVRFKPQYFKRAYNLQDGDIDETPPQELQPGAGAPRLRMVKGGKVDDTASFADAQVPPDQAAIDAAIAQLPAQDIEAAMRELLAPALRAIQEAGTPDEVRQALADAWPEMDTSKLEKLMEQAYFVADLVGRDAVREEAA